MFKPGKGSSGGGVDPLRQLKDQAREALEERSYARAGRLYLSIANIDADNPEWRQRAGEAFRRAGDKRHACEELAAAAESYARQGQLPRALALCRQLVEVDKGYEVFESHLIDIHKRAVLTRKSPSGSLLIAPAEEVQVSRSGRFAVVRGLSSIHVNEARTEAPAMARARASSPRLPEPDLDPTDEPAAPPAFYAVHDEPAEPAFEIMREAPAAPPTARPPAAHPQVLLDNSPLREVLDARPSRQFPAPSPPGHGPRGESGSFEIVIDDSAMERAAAPAPRNTGVAPPAPVGETDFSDLFALVDAPAGLVEPAGPAEPAKPARIAPPPPPVSLGRVPLFASLGADALAAVEQASSEHACTDGEAILHAGDPPGGLYAVLDGTVEAQHGAASLRLGPGGIFGELSLLTDRPRPATVIAIGPARLAEIPRSAIAEAAAQSPDVLRLLLRFFRDRLLDRLIAESPLFLGLGQKEAHQLARRFRFLEVQSRARLIREGAAAPGLFVLLCGEVEVVRGGRRLAELGPGDVFGEMSLLRGAPAVGSVDTCSRCWVLALPRKDFQALAFAYPQVLAYVSELAQKRASENFSAVHRVDLR